MIEGVILDLWPQTEVTIITQSLREIIDPSPLTTELEESLLGEVTPISQLQEGPLVELTLAPVMI